VVSLKGGLAVNGAYIQRNKDAQRVDDHEAVERYLQYSLDAALRAQALAPDSEISCVRVKQLQRRLKELRQARTIELT
jgi:hypothetical protein